MVAATGSGGDTASAIAGLLRAAVGKYFAEEPAALRTSLLQNEIIPNASSFVQSYRLLESSKGSVSLSANVDLDVIRGLMSLTPAKLNAEANSKALIVVKGTKLPEQAASKAAAPANPFAVLELGAKDRFTRRQFAPVVMSVEEASGGSPNDEPTSADFLRSAGARAGARLALGVGSRREKFENENSHNKEDRIVLTATLLDVKSGNVLGRSSVNVNEPKGRRDQFNAELQRMLAEDSKDLFQDLFVAAGRRLGPAEAQDDFAVLRVQYPSNPILVNKLRALLEGSKALKSISEYGVRRGAFDFAIRPNLAPEALQKVVAALVSEEIAITPVGILADDSERRPALAVKISPKSAAAATIGGPSAMDQEDALNGKP
ncbi:MAG: hypothetical protein EOP11_16020 [Proteobacteria bacterium]|nr:MAG: hypothetical protein EOP11_16020 [Pseudomonadota bacterium]